MSSYTSYDLKRENDIISQDTKFTSQDRRYHICDMTCNLKKHLLILQNLSSSNSILYVCFIYTLFLKKKKNLQDWGNKGPEIMNLQTLFFSCLL